jgi:dethiobiotin synthetase
MQGLFITGTDTGVGKTWVGSKLARFLALHSVAVAPRKPAESGCKWVRGKLIPSDALEYFKAIDERESMSDICRYRYPDAIAPNQAARLQGQTLALKMLLEACQCSRDQFLIIEGAGGFYSPIAEQALNADLAQALELPVLVVATDRLGCQNHVLLTLEAIAGRGLQTTAVVLNQVSPTPNDELNNETALKEMISTPLFSLPYGSKNLNELGSFVIDRLKAQG